MCYTNQIPSLSSFQKFGFFLNLDTVVNINWVYLRDFPMAVNPGNGKTKAGESWFQGQLRLSE